MMAGDAMGELLERGWLQMICVDSVDAESWYARWKHPGDRAWRNTQYDNYLLHEVMPFSWQINNNPFLMTTGASFGAYHAMNFALRHPQVVSRVIAMSGIYSIDRWTDGHVDKNVYLNDPTMFIPGETDHNRLEAMRRMDIIIVAGATDPLRHSSERMSSVLFQKGVWNALRIWDGWSHDWPYWKQMLRLYVNGSDG
jgi:esterase/lipase superfamily enzyme